MNVALAGRENRLGIVTQRPPQAPLVARDAAARLQLISSGVRMTPDPAPEHFRAFARRPINLRARLASGGDRPLDEPARLVDLGLGGAQLELGFAPPNGLRLSIALQVPAPCGPLVLDGEVAWSRTLATGVRVGVRFHHRSGAALRELCELLETDELR